MQKKYWLLTAGAVVVLFAVYYWSLGHGDVSTARVEKMEVRPGFEGRAVTYTREENPGVIEDFVRAYNRAERYRDDVGTTHPVRVILTLDSGKKLDIGGGTQGFQTVTVQAAWLQVEKQFNTRGRELESYFEVLVEKYNLR